MTRALTGRDLKGPGVNKKSPVYVLSFMAAICLVFGTGIAIVHAATQGLLAKNAVLHRNRVLCRAFDLPVDGTSADAYQQAVDQHLVAENKTDAPSTAAPPPVRKASASNSAAWASGTASRASSSSPRPQNRPEYPVPRPEGNPGLGARIEESWFTDQFKGLQIDWDNPAATASSSRLPDPDPKNRVDAITGATQTSMTLGRFLNDELDRIRSQYSQPLNPEPLNPEPEPLNR